MIPHNVEANEKEKELHGSIAMGFFIFFKILIYFLKKKFNFKFQISSHLDACTFHGTGWGEPKPTCETLKTTHIGALPYRRLFIGCTRHGLIPVLKHVGMYVPIQPMKCC
jgi:hypothetical protein